MWKFYTTNKVLPTTEQAQLIDLMGFVIAALNVSSETFFMHLTIREREEWLWILTGRFKSKLKVKPKAEPKLGF